MAQKKREYKYNPDSSAMAPKTSPLVGWQRPTVYYTPKAWETIWYLVAENKKEVGWLGTVDLLENGDYLIDEIFLPKQKVTGAETDIDTEDYHRIINELLDSDKYATADGQPRLLYWGHSHVNMGVSPSQQDEDQIAEYLEDAVGFYIRGIYNKAGKTKVDVYDLECQVVHQCVDNQVHLGALSADEYAELDRQMKERVIERVYTYGKTGNKQGLRSLPGGQSEKKSGTLDTYGSTYTDTYGNSWDYFNDVEEEVDVLDDLDDDAYDPQSAYLTKGQRQAMIAEIRLCGVNYETADPEDYIHDVNDPRYDLYEDIEIIYFGVTMGEHWIEELQGPTHANAH